MCNNINNQPSGLRLIADSALWSFKSVHFNLENLFDKSGVSKEKKIQMNDHLFLISSCPGPEEAVHLSQLLLFFWHLMLVFCAFFSTHSVFCVCVFIQTAWFLTLALFIDVCLTDEHLRCQNSLDLYKSICILVLWDLWCLRYSMVYIRECKFIHSFFFPASFVQPWSFLLKVFSLGTS